MKRPMFIVFEGIDGAGTTTQTEMMSSHLGKLNIDHVATHDPGGCEACQVYQGGSCLVQKLVDSGQ